MMVAVVGFALAAAEARAGLLPVSTTVTPDAGNFRWTYSIVLPTDVQIRNGDYFTIYDFNGYIPGSESGPANWAFSTAATGVTPAEVLPVDDPNVPNLTWTYRGSNTTGQTGLGNFWAISPYGDGTESDFTARSHNAVYGSKVANVTSTTVPVQVPVPPGVPEPATLALAAVGLPLVALLRRRQSGQGGLRS
jgi:hypothetical protein